jgi:hypothetical protein
VLKSPRVTPANRAGLNRRPLVVGHFPLSGHSDTSPLSRRRNGLIATGQSWKSAPSDGNEKATARRHGRAAGYRRFLLEFAVFCGAAGTVGCGKTLPTSPAAGCPTIPANFVRTDTLYFPVNRLPDGTPGPKIIAFFVDIYACNGADIAKGRTP